MSQENYPGNPNSPATPKKPSKQPDPYDPLQRQLDEIKRQEHEKHLAKYRQADPNCPSGRQER